jgi:hypothetical protein
LQPSWLEEFWILPFFEVWLKISFFEKCGFSQDPYNQSQKFWSHIISIQFLIFLLFFLAFIVEQNSRNDKK